MMPPRQEIAAALFGLSRLIRLDARGLEFFNASYRGFWNSFFVAALILPVHLLHSAMVYRQSEDIVVGPLYYVLLEIENYVIGWTLFPLVMIWVAGLLDRWPRYYQFLVPYNWFQLVIALLILPMSILSGLGILPAGVAGLFLVMAAAGSLLYLGFIASRGLEVSGVTAFGIILLDVLLSFLVNGTVRAMMVEG